MTDEELAEIERLAEHIGKEWADNPCNVNEAEWKLAGLSTALVAEVLRLREALRKEWDEIQPAASKLAAEMATATAVADRDSARAEVERLRELYKSADAGIGGLMAERDVLVVEAKQLRTLRDWVLNEDHGYLRRVVPRIADIVEVLHLRMEPKP